MGLDFADLELLDTETDLQAVLRAIGGLDHVEVCEHTEETPDGMVTMLLVVSRHYHCREVN